jgi:hypothetical protein
MEKVVATSVESVQQIFDFNEFKFDPHYLIAGSACSDRRKAGDATREGLKNAIVTPRKGCNVIALELKGRRHTPENGSSPELQKISRLTLTLESRVLSTGLGALLLDDRDATYSSKRGISRVYKGDDG